MRAGWVLKTAVMLSVVACQTTSGALPTWEGTEPDAAADAEATSKTEPQVAQAEEVAPSEEDPETPGVVEPTVVAAPQKSESAPSELTLPKPLHAKVNKSCGRDSGVGQKLKSFSLKTPQGKSISSGTYRKRVMLVNFWGTWCKPCLKELPEFDRLYRRYRKHGLTLVAIATDEDATAVQEFVDKKKLRAKIAIGGESYAGQYSSSTFPFSFVVDDRGVIRASYRGFKPECMGKLEADIREQLRKRVKN